MKKLLLMAVLGGGLVGALPVAHAVTIYTEDWGNDNTSVSGNGNIGLLGWAGIAASQTAQPYLGIYAAQGANDPFLGLGLPLNTVYFTGLALPAGSGAVGQTNGPGMFYTTDTSTASVGPSFSDIDPTVYTNLTFNLEVRTGNSYLANYFAVRVGGVWYVATNNPAPDYQGSYPTFTNWSMAYSPAAANWNILTTNATYVTIGAQAGADLSGPITGIGIVELNNTNFASGNNGLNYNQLVINQGVNDFPHSAPAYSASAIAPQYVYVGGGASFLANISGTPTLVYSWQTNGASVSGSRYLGTDTTMLTITNCQASDGLPSYSVVVTNFFGAVTNGGLQLIVSNLPPGLLYSENFPYVGPNGNLPISGVGWVSAASTATTIGIYQNGGGHGSAFSYAPTATTNIYYTTDTNDTGLSGLPFKDINPASYPAISFQSDFVPGNAAGQVSGAISVYWAVAMNGTWYCSAQPADIDLSALSPYKTYQYGFNPAATNWNTLTIVTNGAIIGGQAASALTGNITGAGLVIAHNDNSGSDMNFQNFEITTNAAVGTPPSIGLNVPLPVTVSSGGGASFGVSATGTQPFTYSWTTNGVLVSNGGRISGANTATLTIANLSANDNNLQIVAYVTNAAGGDNSAAVYGPTTLNVTNPPVGLIYSEGFPFVGPVVGDYRVSSVGWVEAVPNVPEALFQRSYQTSEGAVVSTNNGPGTTVFYATTTTDTNQSGLPFPAINLAFYPNLTFSVDIAPNSANAGNVTAYFAVQLAHRGGTNWYVAANALLGPNATPSSSYTTYSMAFNAAAANWRHLTVTGSGGIIGSTATSDLSGVMVGAGLVFVTTGSGGTFDFDNFVIKDLGVVGGINVGPTTGGNVSLSWVGNPSVKLQSSTNLTSSTYWQDVPGTYGLYSLPVTTTGPQKFFRLKTP